MPASISRLSPFLRLPAEIRCMIYALVLPYDDGTDLFAMYPRGFSYSFNPRGLQGYNKGRSAAICRTNNQVYEETAALLYADACYKIVIRPFDSHLTTESHKYCLAKDEVIRLPRSAEYVKHCKVFVHVTEPLMSKHEDWSGIMHDKAGTPYLSSTLDGCISASVGALKVASPLKTLTFEIACQLNSKLKNLSVNKAVDFWTRSLRPYEQIQISQRCTVTISMWLGWSRPCDHSYCAEVQRSLQEYHNKRIKQEDSKSTPTQSGTR
ncbi:MAG: hypothetical protein Q9205_006320 [Flavoplaca limonia]